MWSVLLEFSLATKESGIFCWPLLRPFKLPLTLYGYYKFAYARREESTFGVGTAGI